MKTIIEPLALEQDLNWFTAIHCESLKENKALDSGKPEQVLMNKKFITRAIIVIGDIFARRNI